MRLINNMRLITRVYGICKKVAKDRQGEIFDVSRSEETDANLYAARTTLSMRILRQMASYREVATKDDRKSLRRLLEAEIKPLITDLFRIKRDGFIYVSR